MIALIILGLVIVTLGIYVIVIYNGLVQLKNNVSRNWSNIDVLLKQRYSELPKLIDACKTYMQYEAETLQKITEARSTALDATKNKDFKTLAEAEGLLKGQLLKLFALAENYPDLKTNQTFQLLQTRISALENDISDRREFYNDSVNRNNIRIQQFPEMIVAKLFHFGGFPLLEFSSEETSDVQVEQRFHPKQ